MSETDLESLRTAVAAFRDDRDWAQFHTPKDLAMALSIEASELLELFLWQKESDSVRPDRLESVQQEMADIFIYLLSMADTLDVDLAEAVKRKLDENAQKYASDTEAQVLCERWRRNYNEVRPHSALGYRPPAPQAIVPWPGSTAASLETTAMATLT